MQATNLLSSERKLTMQFRHRIVQLIAPKLYEDYVKHSEWIQGVFAETPRPFTLFLKKRPGERALVGAEIGVASGDNALSICEELNIEKLFLIDPYIPYVDGNSFVTGHVDSCNIAVQKLKKYRDKLEFMKLTSNEAVGKISEKLDFVYIDGNHSYEFVLKDIENYVKPLKSDGIIGGHDYWDLTGVPKAVNESAKKLGWNLTVRLPDWWLQP